MQKQACHVSSWITLLVTAAAAAKQAQCHRQGAILYEQAASLQLTEKYWVVHCCLACPHQVDYICYFSKQAAVT
jgi:hypothetical protein